LIDATIAFHHHIATRFAASATMRHYFHFFFRYFRCQAPLPLPDTAALLSLVAAVAAFQLAPDAPC